MRVQRFDPDQERLRSLGYNTVAHVPVLFGADGRYLREVNWYLRDRARLKWPNYQDPDRKIALGRHVQYPDEKTLKKIADSFVDFFSWLVTRRLQWLTIQYDDILKYEQEQVRGKWSRSRPGTPLSGSTASQRADYATDFLQWAFARGLRGKFEVPLVVSRRRVSTGGSSRSNAAITYVRVSGVRQDPINLRLPSLDELREWLESVEEKRGYRKALACRTILATGIRIEEAAQLPLTFIPMLSRDWHVVNSQVQFLLTEGTKFGKSRHVTIPLFLAEELHRYRTGLRRHDVKKWLQNNVGRPRNPLNRLFLNEYDGSATSSKTIYKAWVSSRIFEGWSPHLGRHTWACYTLLAALKRDAEFTKFQNGPDPTWVASMAKTLISEVIQPQLGHVDEETTHVYLRWLMTHLALPNAFEEWQHFLESAIGV